MCEINKVIKFARLSLLALVGGLAAQSAGAVNMQFSGTLVSAPECKMSDTPIVISFDVVRVETILAGNQTFVSLPVTYSPTCTNIQNASRYTVSLTFGGVAANWNASALTTSNTHVGIIMEDGAGNAFELNKAVAIKDLSNWPRLYVKLARLITSSSIPTGNLTASGTLIITIQ